ncbi:MAG: hypothetical protein V5A62_10665 [Haloarculaceae archaeon]
MEHPELVQSRLDGERVLARVGLGGDDAVLVTPTRTLVYRSEGLLSDESVSAYPHDAERVELRSGRRKTTFRLVYVDGAKDFTVPSGNTHEVLVPVLTGVLRTAGVLEGDESVRGAYRFSELTLVVTDRRVVKHVGSAVWDEEFEIAPYADLTGLAFEEGSVATEVSLEVDGYPQRVKVPNEHAGTVRRTIQEAAFEFHGVSSLAELDTSVASDEDEEDVLEKSGFTELLGEDGTEEAGDGGPVDAGAAAATADDGDEGSSEGESSPFGTDEREGGTILDPVGRDTAETGTGGDAAGAAGTTSGEPDAAGSQNPSAGKVPPEVAERLEELTVAVERQSELLENQGEVIRQLVEELRRGR